MKRLTLTLALFCFLLPALSGTDPAPPAPPSVQQLIDNYAAAEKEVQAATKKRAAAKLAIEAEFKRLKSLADKIGVKLCPEPPPIPPKPPEPPPQPPPSPAPIPADGLHVLMVYEKDDLAKYPASQLDVLYSTDLRKRIGDYRIWDKNVNPAGDSKLWQDAFNRPRASVPWLIISNGKSGYEGPLPTTLADMDKLLNQYK